MEPNKNPIDDFIPSTGQVSDGVAVGALETSVVPAADSLEQATPVDTNTFTAPLPQERPKPPLFLRLNKEALMYTAGAAIAIALLCTAFVMVASNMRSEPNVSKNSSLAGVEVDTSRLTPEMNVSEAKQLVINGELQVAEGLVLAPSTAPASPARGQIYYDKATNKPYYYDGGKFVSLGADAAQGLTSLGSLTGAALLGQGLIANGNTLSLSDEILGASARASAAINAATAAANTAASSLSASKVTSLQGLTGALALTSGNGIAISGTTITNTGVLGVVAGSGINITNNGDGTYTVTNIALGGGTVVETIGGLDGDVLLGAGLSTSGNSLINTGVTQLTGTIDQITVSNSTGNVTLSLPQSIATTSSPTFSGLTLAGNLTANGTISSGNNFTQGGLIVHDGTGRTAAIRANILGQNTTYILPDPGMASVSLCLTSGNCSAAGTAGGDLTGTYPNPTIASLQGAALSIAGVTTGQFLQYNGTAFVNQSITGDISIDNSGLATIANGAVTNAKLQHSSIDITAGAGLTGGGSTSLGSSTSLSVVYGSTAGTAVQGNTTLVCAAGNGNLSGGGDTITLGAGGTCSDITISDNPVFAGMVSVMGSGGIELGEAGVSNGIVVLYSDTSSFQTTLTSAATGQNQTIIIPDVGAATDTVCLFNLANCAGVGGGITGNNYAQNYITKYDAVSGEITASQIYDDGTTVGIGAGVPNASYKLDVAGDTNIAGDLDAVNSSFSGDLTVSGSVWFSGYGEGLLVADSSGVVTSGSVDRNSPTHLTGTLTVPNGGTGTTSFTSNGILYGNSTGAIQSTASANDSILVTDNSGNPSLSQQLPGAVQSNITQTGTLSSGSIDTGFGTITTANNITTTANIQGNTLNATTTIELNGTDINAAGTLTNVAYLNQANTFTANNTFSGANTFSNTNTFSSTVNIQGNLTLGLANTTDASLTFANATNSNLANIQVTAPTGTGNATYTIPSLPGGSSADICLSTGNCATAGSAGGDLTGTYPNPTIAKLQGIDLSLSSVATGQILQYNGTQFINQTLSGDITVDGSGVTTIANGAVTNAKLANDSLTVTAGNGLNGGGLVALGSSTSLSVAYGSTTNTAVQGNTTLTCAAGTGNLSGGGDTITLGSGGTCSDITITNSPSFSGTLAVTGSGGITVGNNSTAGILTLHDGSGLTGILNVATLGQGTTYTLPDPGQATADICLSTGNCATAGSAGGDLTGTYPNPTIAKLQGIDLSLSSIATGQILQYNGSQFVNQTLSGDITVDGSGVTTIANGAVTNAKLANDSLTVTAGNGLNGGGLVALGSSTSLSVAYGSTTNTAVQGNTTLTCAAGTGNLSGGGDTITLGSGGTCSDITITNSPSFSGTLSVTGATNIQGTLILGLANTTAGTLDFANSTNSNISRLQATAPSGTGTATFTLPSIAGGTSDEICTVNSGNCAGSGGGLTGSGTNGTIAQFTGTGTLGNSNLVDTGTTLEYSGDEVCTVTAGNCAGSGGGVTGGGTNGRIAKFTGAGTVADSGLSESGSALSYTGTLSVSSTVTAGTLSVTGITTLNGNTSITGSNTLTVGTGATTLGGTLAVTGTITGNSTIQGTRFISTASTGTAPFQVASTTLVTNLNADLLDGQHASAFAPASGGNYIAKNTNDTSSANYAGNLLSLQNTNTGAAGVLQLTNAGTNSALSITQAANPASGQALIYANNTNGSPSGSLIDLQTSGTSRFYVMASGNVVSNGASDAVFRGENKTTSSTNSNVTVFQSGNVSGATSTSGHVSVITGNSTTSGNTGNLNLYTGNATNGNSGNVIIEAGGASGTRGTINIGNTNASAVNISRSGVATTINGSLTVTQATALNSSLTVAGASTFNGSVSVSGSNTLTVGTGATTLGGTLAVTGTITGNSTIQGTRLISTASTGTAPFQVASTTLVTNLNADLLDGQHASYFAPASGANYIAKNAVDSSTVNSLGYQLTLVNNSSGAAGVLALQNAGTNSALSITQSSNPTSGQALIFANNTNGSPSGTLIDLRVGGSLRFSVGTTGNVMSTGNYYNSGGVFKSIDQSAASTNSVFTQFSSGDVSGATSSSGGLSLRSGNSTTSGSTGAVTLASGNATSGNSGSINIDSGTASGTNGTISVGTANASGVTISRVGVATTVAGDLTVQGATRGVSLNDVIAGTPGWAKLGTLSLPQGGNTAVVTMYGAAGYNANANQDAKVELFIRTSNGSSVNPDGFAANATATRYGNSPNFVGGIKLVSNNAGVAATSYDIYVSLGAYPGKSYFTVSTGASGSWVSGVATASDPGVSSSTVLDVPFGFRVNDASVFSGGLEVRNASGLALGTSGSYTGGIVFRGSGNSNTLTLQGPASPSAGNYTLSIPAIGGNATLCTTDSICAGYAASAGANYIGKNTNDTSTANYLGTLLGLTNSNTGAAGVLSLTNAGTNSALSITQSSNASSGQALIYASLTSGSPSGNLMDLRVGGATRLYVSSAGDAVASGVVVSASGAFRTHNQSAASTSSNAAYFQSGATSGASSHSGGVIVGSGNSSTSGNTGNVYLQSGTATSGNSGNILIDSGTASGTKGSIQIGGTNASSVTIARAGIQTTIGGNLNLGAGTMSTSVISNITPVYIIGTGNDNTGPGSYIKIGDTQLTRPNGSGGGGQRGLNLVVLNKDTLAIISNATYDTYGNATESNDLAIALDSIDNTQIGILNSRDAWEAAVTANLRNSFTKLGLTYAKAASTGQRKPYAAIFLGSTVGGTSKATEVIANNTAGYPYAELSGWFMRGGSNGFSFSVTGNNGTNALRTANGTGTALEADMTGNLTMGGTLNGLTLNTTAITAPGSLTISTTGASTLSLGTVNTNNGVSISRTGVTTTVNGSLSVTEDATFNDGLQIASGSSLVNASSTILSAINISNHPTGGTIGSAAATVDVSTTFNVTQTTAGQVLTLPNPTNTAAGRIVFINSVSGNASFAMYGIGIDAGVTQGFMWNGSAWTPLNASTSGNAAATVGAVHTGCDQPNGGYINVGTLYLQAACSTAPGLVTTGAQTLAGAKTFSSLITGQAGIYVTGTTSINTSGAGTTTIGNASGGAVSINSGSNSLGLLGNTVDINTSGSNNVNIKTGGNGAVNIGNTGSGTISLQSSSTTSIIANAGSLDFTASSTSAGNIYLRPNGTGNTGAIVRPTNNSTQTFMVQNSSGSGVLIVNTATALVSVSNLSVSSNASVSGTLTIGGLALANSSGHIYSASPIWSDAGLFVAGGYSWTNNASRMYTNANLAGAGYIYSYNYIQAAGALYTDNLYWADNGADIMTTNANVNGAGYIAANGALYAGGLAWSNNGGRMYTGSEVFAPIFRFTSGYGLASSGASIGFDAGWAEVSPNGISFSAPLHAGNRATCFATAGLGYKLTDCTSTPIADYAESYPVASDASYGDIVATGTEMVNTYGANSEGEVDWGNVIGQVTKLVKTNTSHQQNTVGIVSNNYSDFSSTGNNIKSEDNPMPVALSGRLPVKITTGSDPIQPGDYITTSADPGKGMKAPSAGFVIGKALESWTPGSGKSTVMVFVEQGYWNGPSQTDYIQSGGNGTLNSLTITGTADFASLNVTGNTSLYNLSVETLHVTDSLAVDGDLTVQGLTTVANIMVNGHIISAGDTPEVEALEALGVDGALVIDGNDTAGTITLTTGAIGLAAGELGKINFSEAFAKTPRIIISAQDDASDQARIFPSGKAADSFRLKAGAVLAPNTTYVFDYFVIE